MARRSRPAPVVKTRRHKIAVPLNTTQPDAVAGGRASAVTSVTVPEALLGPTDVAQMLGVPISWIYAKAEAGALPSYKLGHYRRFKRTEIEEYLRRCHSNGHATHGAK
jgi:excisionase family DNA binding protein